MCVSAWYQAFSLTTPQQGTIAAIVFLLAAGYALVNNCQLLALLAQLAAQTGVVNISIYGISITAVVAMEFLSTLGMIGCCVSSKHITTTLYTSLQTFSVQYKYAV